MATFEYKIQKHRNKTEAKSKEQAFFEWCDNVGLGLEGFAMTVQSEETWKNKRITYYIESYGYFQVQGGWMVYISYRGDLLNVIRYHSWKWADGRAIRESYKLERIANI